MIIRMGEGVIGINMAQARIRKQKSLGWMKNDKK